MSFDSPSIYQSPIKDNKEESLTYNEIGGEYPEDFPVTDLPTPIDDEQDNPGSSSNTEYRNTKQDYDRKAGRSGKTRSRISLDDFIAQFDGLGNKSTLKDISKEE